MEGTSGCQKLLSTGTGYLYTFASCHKSAVKDRRAKQLPVLVWKPVLAHACRQKIQCMLYMNSLGVVEGRRRMQWGRSLVTEAGDGRIGPGRGQDWWQWYLLHPIPLPAPNQYGTT